MTARASVNASRALTEPQMGQRCCEKRHVDPGALADAITVPSFFKKKIHDHCSCLIEFVHVFP